MEEEKNNSFIKEVQILIDNCNIKENQVNLALILGFTQEDIINKTL
jgi:hypothetical protein